MKFKKLPVEVEVVEQVEEPTPVETPEGTYEADAGDIILRGVHGERYPIKPAIFAKTYVPSDPEDADAFAFYQEVLPDGVAVYAEEDPDRGVVVEGVSVSEDALQDLDRDGYERAVEFARELSSVLGLPDPTDELPPEGEP